MNDMSRVHPPTEEVTTPAWWVLMLAGGIAGKPKPAPERRDLLEARIAGRRAAATARMKATRARSERAIARLLKAITA
jgi:hypothetical protein